MSRPTFAPPDGRHWVLFTGVSLYTGDGSITDLPLPEGYGPPYDLSGNPTHYVNSHGRTSHDWGTNYGVSGAPDAADYTLDSWEFLAWRTIIDGTEEELQAITPLGGSGSRCITAVNPQVTVQPFVGGSPTWPLKIAVDFVSHSHSCYAGSIQIIPTKWVGAVWVAMPGIDDYPTINGTPPTDLPIDDCPPPCGQSNPTLGAGLPPDADAGLSVRWGREEGDVVWALPLGAVGGLTWDAEWDDERAMVLDGLHYTVTVNATGGDLSQAEYHWANLPGTTATGAARWFTVDVTPVDDPGYPLR